MWSARPSAAPSVLPISSVTRAGSRIWASLIQNVPASMITDELGGGFDREARLSRASGAGERDEPGAIVAHRAERPRRSRAHGRRTS